jgi:hypothetical protein
MLVHWFPQPAAVGTLLFHKPKRLSVFFRDPDGLEAEVLWNKDTAALAEGSRPA